MLGAALGVVPAVIVADGVFFFFLSDSEPRDIPYTHTHTITSIPHTHVYLSTPINTYLSSRRVMTYVSHQIILSTIH